MFLLSISSVNQSTTEYLKNAFFFLFLCYASNMPTEFMEVENHVLVILFIFEDNVNKLSGDYVWFIQVLGIVYGAFGGILCLGLPL